MRYFLLLLSFCSFFGTAYSQTIQNCLVLEYNEALKKTPLANVVIKVKNAGATLSDENGECSLRFRTLQPGEKVEYEQGNVTREGYEVFNKDALEQWTLTGGKSSYKIVMCKSDRFKRIRDRYEAAMSKNYREQRDREQQDNKRALESSRITKKEYDRKAQEIQDEYEQKLENISEYIDRFARIDIGEMNEVEARALQLMQEGKIEDAIQVYESLNLIGKKSQNRANHANVTNSITQMWKIILDYREENKRLNESIKKQIDIYRALGGKANRHKADSLYCAAAFADTTDIDFLEDYYRYSSNRGKTEETTQANAILYNYYLKEFRNAPKVGIYEHFENLDEVLQYAKDKKYSVECISKDNASSNGGYRFNLHSKSDYEYELIKCIGNNDLIKVSEKKQLLAELLEVLDPGSYGFNEVLDLQIEMADSAEVWPLIKKRFITGVSSSYDVNDLLKKAFDVTSKKDVISFLTELNKKDRKHFKTVQNRIRRLQKSYDNYLNSYEVLSVIDTLINHNDTIFDYSLSCDVVYPHEFSTEMSDISEFLSKYALRSIYGIWKANYSAESIKGLSSYENELLKVYCTDTMLHSMQKYYHGALADKVVKTLENVSLKGNVIVRPEDFFDDYLYRNIFSNIAYHYKYIGDKQNYYKFLRLYNSDDAVITQCLEQGDTITATEIQLEILEKARQESLDDLMNLDSIDYANALSSVMEFYIRIHDYEQAKIYGLQAIDIYKRAKENHWSIQNIYRYLAQIYEQQHEWSKAIDYWILNGNHYYYFRIAKLYWEHMHDATNALLYLQKTLDYYDQRFEEFASEDEANSSWFSYSKILDYMHDVHISSGTGDERKWIEFLRKQLLIYDTYMLHQKYLANNNAHMLRREIVWSYAKLMDTATAKEFLDERAERMKKGYEANPSKDMLYAYGDAAGYDYYSFYSQVKDVERAEFYALKAADIYQKLYDEYGMAEPLGNVYRELTMFFEETNKYHKALKYSQLALKYYVNFDKYYHLLAYIYSASAWAKYMINPNDEESYQGDIENCAAVMPKIKDKNFTNKDKIKQRINALSSLETSIKWLNKIDESENYDGYENNQDIHGARSRIITKFVQKNDIDGCLKFLDTRAAIVTRNAEKTQNSTMLYVMGDALGYDYYNFYMQIGNHEKAEEYAIIAYDIYEQLDSIYHVSTPLGYMYKLLSNLIKDDKEKSQYYHDRFTKTGSSNALKSMIARLDSIDNQGIYDNYIRSNIHSIRAYIISQFVQDNDTIGCLKFLDDRAAKIKERAGDKPSSTMLYVLGDAIGYDYYSFYQKIGNKDKAIEYAIKAYEIYEQLDSIYNISGPMKNMYALLISQIENDTEKLIYYKAKFLTRLLAENPESNRLLISSTQDGIGSLYCDLQDYSNAEKYYLQALENRTILFRTDPEGYRDYLASTQHNLGLVYEYQADYDNSEKYFMQALENRTVLFECDSVKYRESLAWTQINLGIIYINKCDTIKSEKYLLQSLENRMILFQQNSDFYRSELAWVQYELGLSYYLSHDLNRSAKYFKLSEENFEILTTNDPSAFRGILAETQKNIGIECCQLGDYMTSRKYLNLAKENYEQLLLSDSSFYINYYLNVQNCIAVLYAYEQDFTKAFELVEKSINLIPTCADFYDSKGEIYLIQGNNEQALEMWRKVMELSPDFLKKYPAGTELSNGLKKLGLIE